MWELNFTLLHMNITLSGFIVVLLLTRDVKDGVHQTKGWSNSGKDNNNDNDNSELFINYLAINE